MRRVLVAVPVAVLALGAAAFLLVPPRHAVRSEAAAAAAYRTAQAASYHHQLGEAEAGFIRARDLTTDPDKAAWAQYQLASCTLAQPAKRHEGMTELHRLIHDYPHHFLAARAQADLDRLSGKQSEVAMAAPIDADCGPECLQYLLSHSFHRTTSLALLKKLAGTDEHGTTLLGLQKAARVMGLRAEGMKVDLAYLRQLPMPVIAWTRRSHFVALLGTPAALSPPFFQLRLHDPTQHGERTMAPAVFSQQWDGYVLALSAKL